MNLMPERIKQLATEFNEVALQKEINANRISIKMLQEYIANPFSTPESIHYANTLVQRIQKINLRTQWQTAKLKNDILTADNINQKEVKKVEIKTKPKEKITTKKPNLVAKSKELLKESKISYTKAITLVSATLNVPVVYNDVFTKKLKTYQKEHFLTDNWIIWAETYAEMQVEPLIIIAQDKIDTQWITEKTLVKIKNTLTKLSFGSKNYMMLQALVKWFNDNPNITKTTKQKSLIEEIINTNKKREKSPEWIKVKKKLEKHQEVQKSFYQIIKDDSIPWDEKIKLIATDPLMLMVWGLLFLFGVVWWGTKFTDSPLKRIGWIIWWALFGKSLWNKIGAGEFIDDTTKIASNKIDYLKSKPAQIARKDAYATLKKTGENIWKKFNSENWKLFQGKVFDANDSLEWDEATKYKIDKDNLWVLDSYLSPALTKNGTPDSTAISAFTFDKLGESEKEALLKHYNNNQDLLEKDIKKYTSFHFSHALSDKWVTWFDKLTATVTGGITTATNAAKKAVSEIENKFKNAIIENNPALNTIVQEEIASLINSSKEEKVKIGESMLASLYAGTFDTFELSTNSTLNTSLIPLVQKIKYIVAWEKYIQEQISKFDTYVFNANEGWDTQSSLEEKLAEINLINLDDSEFKGGFTYNKERFNTAKESKIFELYKTAQKRKIKVLWTEDVKKYIDEHQKIIDEAQKQEAINSKKENLEKALWEIPDIPNSETASPKDYVDFLETKVINPNGDWKEEISVSELFKVEESGEHKNPIWDELAWKKTKLGEIKSDFVESYKVKVDNYNEKITTISKKLSQLPTTQNEKIDKNNVRSKITEIKKISIDLYTLVWKDKKDTDYLKWIVKMYKMVTTDAPIEKEPTSKLKEVASLLKLDDIKLESTTILWVAILNQMHAIESNYKVATISPDLDISNTQELWTTLENIKEDYNIIVQFWDPDLKKSDLKEQVNNLVQSYVNAIKKASTPDKLQKIKLNYESFVDNPFGVELWIFGKNLIENNSAVEEAVEEKKWEIKKKEEIKKKADEKLKERKDIINLFTGVSFEHEKLKWLSPYKNLFNYIETNKKDFKQLYNFMTTEKSSDISQLYIILEQSWENKNSTKFKSLSKLMINDLKSKLTD